MLVLNQKCVRDQTVSLDEARRTDPLQKQIPADRMLRPYDVLVNSTGVGTLGRVAQVLDLPEAATVDSHLTIVRPAPDRVHPRYLGLAIRSLQREIESLAEGSTGQTELGRERLANLKVPLPPRDEQHAIAHILGALDDKVELDRRMNKTVEAIAQTLFKSWFVNFDPVRAKAEGRDIGLPKHIADVFPARLVDSELGEIPEGWEVRPLGELLELAYGKALKAEERRDGSVPVYGSNGQIGWHNEALAAGPGIIVGRKGNPGIATWAPTDFFAIDTTFYVIPRQACPSLHFLFHALRRQDLASLGADSAVPGLNRNIAYMSTQVLPPRALLERFDQFVRPLTERVHSCNEESRNLAEMRDALLPRLISGELRVKDATAFLRSAV